MEVGRGDELPGFVYREPLFLLHFGGQFCWVPYLDRMLCEDSSFIVFDEKVVLKGFSIFLVDYVDEGQN